MFILAPILLVLSILQATLVSADTTIPWPANFPLCQGNPQVSFPDKGSNPGIRWCSDGCLFWTCGFVFPGPAAKQFAWPPVVGGNSIKYGEITADMLVQWLLLRKVDRRYVSAKDALFQLAAAEVVKVAGRVGVQGGPGFS